MAFTPLYYPKTSSPKVCPLKNFQKLIFKPATAICAEVSRPVSRVVTLLTLIRTCIGRTLSDAPAQFALLMRVYIETAARGTANCALQNWKQGGILPRKWLWLA